LTLKVTRGHRLLFQSKACIWLSIGDLWLKFQAYLTPFPRYSAAKSKTARPTLSPQSRGPLRISSSNFPRKNRDIWILFQRKKSSQLQSFWHNTLTSQTKTVERQTIDERQTTSYDNSRTLQYSFNDFNELFVINGFFRAQNAPQPVFGRISLLTPHIPSTYHTQLRFKQYVTRSVVMLVQEMITTSSMMTLIMLSTDILAVSRRTSDLVRTRPTPYQTTWMQFGSTASHLWSTSSRANGWDTRYEFLSSFSILVTLHH